MKKFKHETVEILSNGHFSYYDLDSGLREEAEVLEWLLEYFGI